MRLPAATLLGLLLLVAPAAAKPVVETAAAGNVRAEFAYDTREEGPPKNLVLRVFVDGEQVVERRLDNADFLYPANLNLGRRSVRVRDFDGDGTPEALFDTFTGGAHCCVSSILFDGDRSTELYTGNVGYRLVDPDGDGVPEFRTADDAFSARYSSFAASLPPLRVLEYRDGDFADVTRAPAHRPALRAEIRRLVRTLRRSRERARRDPFAREGVRAALAAIAADRCSLGDCAPGYARLDAAVARGEVRRAFARSLRRDLREGGYDTAAAAAATRLRPPAFAA